MPGHRYVSLDYGGSSDDESSNLRSNLDNPKKQELGNETEGICIGYKKSIWKVILFHILNGLTLFFPTLFCKWYPILIVKFTCVPTSLRSANIVLVKAKTRNSVCRVITETVDFIPDGFLSSRRSSKKGHDGSPSTSPRVSFNSLGQVKPFLRHFTVQHEKFVWDDDQRAFRRIDGLEGHTTSQLIENFKGLSETKREQTRVIYGSNFIDVEVKSYFDLFMNEFLTPFYMFQFGSIIVWTLDSYVYYATCVVFLATCSIALAVRENKKQRLNLKEMAEGAELTKVTVRTSDGDEQEICSRDLVPGDVIVIPPKGLIMPCDAVITAGSCIVNESMLTGESIPVRKSALVPSDEMFHPDKFKINTIFAGTKVIQTRFYAGNKVTCTVVRSGFNTAKGQLIRSIMCPTDCEIPFYKETKYFIAILLCVSILGMIYSFFLFKSRNEDGRYVFFRVADVLTIVIPPALPAAVTVGVYCAQGRLKAKQIFCISPQRINFCGRLKLFCFDKTGTLTEDGLDFWCAVPCEEKVSVSSNSPLEVTSGDGGGDAHQEKLGFSDPVPNPSVLPNKSQLLRGMATCHSLTFIDKQLVGDPLDLKMFEATGWEMEEPMNQEDETARFDLLVPTVIKRDGIELAVVRDFEFNPQLQRMSVVCSSLVNSEMVVYCKGSPEKVTALCRDVPADYEKTLDSFTIRGFRVLAMAWKPVSNRHWHKIQRLPRDEIEKDLNFAGLLVMRNSLKPATEGVIKSLRDGDIRTVMVTGDNLLTALSVARECGMIPGSDKVLEVDVINGKLEYKLCAHHTEVKDEEEVAEDEDSSEDGRGHHGLVDASDSGNHTKSESGSLIGTISNGVKISLVPRTPDDEDKETKDAKVSFDGVEVPLLLDDTPTEVLDSSPEKSRFGGGRGSSARASETFIDMEGLIPIPMTQTSIQKTGDHGNFHLALTGRTWAWIRDNCSKETQNKIVRKGTVFARMPPEGKRQLVESLQDMDYVVGMCGDGANDCAALKAAHVGISLSDAEASVAAPFTSKVPDISCTVDVILEGRCALVTSFGIFKFMALYSLVQFMTVIMLYTIGTNLSDKQFLFIDLGIITFLALLMGRTEPHHKIVPKRPIGRLVSFQNLVSIVIQVCISGGILLASLKYLRSQPWFQPIQIIPGEAEKVSEETWETTTLFSVSCFQYLVLALVFSKGPPFQKPVYSNGLLVVAYATVFMACLLVTVYPFDLVSNFLKIMPVEEKTQTYRLTLLLFPAVNLVLALLTEMFVNNAGYFKRIARAFGFEKKKAKYQIIMEEIEDDPYWPPIRPTT